MSFYDYFLIGAGIAALILMLVGLYALWRER